MTKDAKKRFNARATDYAKARPSYPEQMLDFFRDTLGLAAGMRVADLGSGTGILSALLLDRGAIVYGVEPNLAMRAEAERILGHRPAFHSIAAAAETTGLPDKSVDWVVAAQAFHWFEIPAARDEIHRILRQGGVCALIWNERAVDTTPFLRAYEAFLDEWGTDYHSVKATYEDLDAIRSVLGPGYAVATFPNAQVLDWEGLKARLRSVSYVPGPDDPRAGKMIEALHELFDAHQTGRTVRIDYTTKVYYARLDDSTD